MVRSKYTEKGGDNTVRIRRMDKTGHSCLAESYGTEVWSHAGHDVPLPFAQQVVHKHLNNGFMLVDENSKRLTSPGEMSSKSAYLLMPPVVGG